ncbi:hypothetical protein ACQPX6_02740 [Actinomycetospora sp. CA-101289]|uniref:hypothetical protein n=1 Tax=Actinomycetospora sp. CA-101289 TaxID=3239893 RepID=UPI003D96BC73
MARGQRTSTGAQVVGGLLVVGLAILVIKWLAITALILAVPFGLWWLVDRSRTAAPVPAGPAYATSGPWPAPTFAPRPELAADEQVTVTREEDHQDVLARHHRAGATPTSVPAELWSSRVSAGRHRGDFAVEVRVGGQRVGELTAAMSARYRHLVDVAGPVRCRGVVTYGDRGYQIDLRLPAV